MQKLDFEIAIAAPRARVWDTMIAPDTYRQWTSAFAEGSDFAGSWDEGAEIRFIGPNGDGMFSEIAENRRHEVISIRHLGMIENGVVDTTSEKVRAWTPAYETYRFADAGAGGCRLSVSVDMADEYAQHMRDTFPKALALLKGLCEK